MTLRSRNTLVLIAFMVLCISVVVFFVLVLNLDLGSVRLVTLLAEGRAYYLDFTWTLTNQTPVVNIVSPGVSLLIAWLAAFVFLKYFRKISSPQLFFLALFWLSMSTELVRVINLYLINHNATIGDQMFLARIAIIGRIIGSLALFAASLYSAGIKLQHQETILGCILLVAVAMGYLIPIDIDRIGQELLFVPASGFSLDIFRILTGVLTVSNFLKYAITTKDAREFVLVIPIVFLILGQELLFLTMDWFGMTVAWLFLASGSAWVARRFINNYLWY